MIQSTHPSIAKFQEHVQLKDYRPRTKKEYVRYVRRLADHFQRDPATLSEACRDARPHDQARVRGCKRKPMTSRHHVIRSHRGKGNYKEGS